MSDWELFVYSIHIISKRHKYYNPYHQHRHNTPHYSVESLRVYVSLCCMNITYYIKCVEVPPSLLAYFAKLWIIYSNCWFHLEANKLISQSIQICFIYVLWLWHVFVCTCILYIYMSNIHWRSIVEESNLELKLNGIYMISSLCSSNENLLYKDIYLQLIVVGHCCLL